MIISKKMFWLLYGLLLMNIGCVKKAEPDPLLDLFNPSFKEQKKNVVFLEYYDTISDVYSNFKYNFSIRSPKNWERDQGVSEHTIFRSFQKDSGYSLSANVIEIKYNIEDSYWEDYKKNQIYLEKKFKEIIEKQINSSIIHDYTNITFLKNYKCLKRKYDYQLINGDKKVDMTTISYQIPKDNYIYNFTITVPNIFFQKKPVYFDNILSDVNWLPNKELIKKEINK